MTWPYAYVAKVSLAGFHYPDTTDFFGDAGVIDVTDELAMRGWSVEGRQLYRRITTELLQIWLSGGLLVTQITAM